MVGVLGKRHEISNCFDIRAEPPAYLAGIVIITERSQETLEFFERSDGMQLLM